MNATKGIVTAGLLALCAGPASAEVVDGWYFDVDTCDNHGEQRAVEELGLLFPPDELIETEWFTTDLSACPVTDDPNTPNVVVEMLNLTGRSWDNLFYVADPETFISNVDGLAWSINQPGYATQAFRIDWAGPRNINLIFESKNRDNVFEPMEIWQFILQDYGNSLGLPPHLFGSYDFAGASAGDFDSSGSIVQFIPSPGGLPLLGLAGLIGMRRRR